MLLLKILIYYYYFLDHSLNVIFVGVAKRCWVLFYFIPLISFVPVLQLPPLLQKAPMLASELDKNTQAEAQLLIKFSSLLDAHFRFALLPHIVLFLRWNSIKFRFLPIALSINTNSSLETFQNILALHSGL